MKTENCALYKYKLINVKALYTEKVHLLNSFFKSHYLNLTVQHLLAYKTQHIQFKIHVCFLECNENGITCDESDFFNKDNAHLK